jgi:hypothetical protein
MRRRPLKKTDPFAARSSDPHICGGRGSLSAAYQRNPYVVAAGIAARDSLCTHSGADWLLGAVDIMGGSLCMQPEEGKFNWVTFHGFLESFLRRKYRGGQKLAMIIDNAGFHKKKELWPFFAENRNRLRLLWLPPYSPELNPVERVWRLTRQARDT